MDGNTAAAVETEENDGPPECGDPTCAGHIDETTGCCVLCGVEASTPCRACDGYGSHAGECPERALSFAEVAS
jgi:hypothetical protein